MSWFSGMLGEEVRVPKRCELQMNNDSSAFCPSDESLRIFDELKGRQNDRRWGLGSQPRAQVRSGVALLSNGDGNGNTGQVTTHNNSRHVQQRHMRNPRLQNCRRWFAGLDIGRTLKTPTELHRHQEGASQYLHGFKPSEESLRIFDEIKGGEPGVRRSRLRSGRRAEKRGRDKRFDPFQRRCGGIGVPSKSSGERMCQGLGKPAEPVPPLDPEAVKWADAVRALERRSWDERERELARCQQKQLPPQLRSHYPSVASGNVVAWEVEEEELQVLRREHQLKMKQSRKGKGMLEGVWKVGKAVANRFAKLVERAWRGVLEAGKSFLSLLSQTVRHDSTRNSTGYDLRHENRSSDVVLECCAEDQV